MIADMQLTLVRLLAATHAARPLQTDTRLLQEREVMDAIYTMHLSDFRRIVRVLRND